MCATTVQNFFAFDTLLQFSLFGVLNFAAPQIANNAIVFSVRLADHGTRRVQTTCCLHVPIPAVRFLALGRSACYRETLKSRKGMRGARKEREAFA